MRMAVPDRSQTVSLASIRVPLTSTRFFPKQVNVKNPVAGNNSASLSLWVSIDAAVLFVGGSMRIADVARGSSV